MGSFKLCGSPMRNGSHSAKRMVASIFSKLDSDSGKLWSVLVTLSNAVHDQIQVSMSTIAFCGRTKALYYRRRTVVYCNVRIIVYFCTGA